ADRQRTHHAGRAHDPGAEQERTADQRTGSSARRHHQERQAALRTRVAVRRSRTTRARKNMPKILLVEDNEMNRDMLSRRLARNGFEIIVAVDGEQGVAMAASERPDLILMDMSLPVVDGWEATRRVKASSATCVIPVIALTAHALLEDKEKALAAG